MTETIDALAMVENIIEAHPHHAVIIGGDFNCELNNRSPFDPLWAEFCTKYDLVSCDDRYPSSSFTYRHNSLNHIKWNDHFLVSKTLFQANSLNSFHILDEGDNPSDHLPILMSLSTVAESVMPEQNDECVRESLKWEKISESQKAHSAHSASE